MFYGPFWPYYTSVTISSNGVCGWTSPQPICDEQAARASLNTKIRLLRVVKFGGQSVTKSVASLWQPQYTLVPAQYQSLYPGAVIATVSPIPSSGQYITQVTPM